MALLVRGNITLVLIKYGFADEHVKTLMLTYRCGLTDRNAPTRAHLITIGVHAKLYMVKGTAKTTIKMPAPKFLKVELHMENGLTEDFRKVSENKEAVVGLLEGMGLGDAQVVGTCKKSGAKSGHGQVESWLLEVPAEKHEQVLARSGERGVFFRAVPKGTFGFVELLSLIHI